MLVSHDRALLRSVCDEFWLVTRGGVEPFDGDLGDYQRYLLEEGKRMRESLKDAGKQDKVPNPAAPHPAHPPKPNRCNKPWPSSTKRSLTCKTKKPDWKHGWPAPLQKTSQTLRAIAAG
ncbi:MAG: hypothetical protein ACYCZQ_10735 [Burkholderiales bacterium]